MPHQRKTKEDRMKKSTMIMFAAALVLSANAFAWGKKEKSYSYDASKYETAAAKTDTETTTTPAAKSTAVETKAAATSTAVAATAPAEQKKLISFDRLVKLLLNEGVATELKLTVSQKAEIAAANDGLKTDLKAARDEFNAKTAEIRAEYEAKLKPYKDALRVKTDEVKKVKVEELNSALTKDQQEKLAVVMEDPKKYMK
jgi:hypothetical protein